MTDIVLNLKEVLPRCTPTSQNDRIEAEGLKIKAGDIIADDQVEILNPGHHICTILRAKAPHENGLPSRSWLFAR